jgi:hypothetical protein
MNVVSLAEEIHDQSWAMSPVKPIGRSFALRYLDRLSRVDRVEFLTYCFHSFDGAYNMSLLLSLPELWELFHLDDWKKVALLLSPRPEIGRFDPTGQYSDVAFFIRWLKLDGLRYALSMPNLPNPDKIRIVRYCAANAVSLMGAPDDRSDLDGVLLCAASRVDVHRARLLAEDKHLIPAYSDETSFHRYVAQWTAVLKSGG